MEQESKVLVGRIFDGMLDKLSKPGGWTQGAFARDRWGEQCSSMDRNAHCFCIAGARNRAIEEVAADVLGVEVPLPCDTSTQYLHDLPDHLATAIDSVYIAESQVMQETTGLAVVSVFNDAPGRTQDEVLDKVRLIKARALGE